MPKPDNPLVSIIICCYNRAHLLPKTMESVFAQKYKPVEIVVIDDGSTDNTPELMSNYKDKIRYFWQKNQGITAARNTACRLAKGGLIAFQDDDDLMPADRITLLYQALCRYPSAVLAMGDWAEIDALGNFNGRQSKFINRFDNHNQQKSILIDNAYDAVLWSKVTPTPHTTLFKRADGERIGWFDKRFFYACEDTDFFARLGQLGSIIYVPQVVSFYRRGHGSLLDNNILHLSSKLLLFEKHLKKIRAGQKELKNRLQIRMLRKINKLAALKNSGAEIPDTIFIDQTKKCLSLLRLKHKLAYRWLTIVKLPIRKIILNNEKLSRLLQLSDQRKNDTSCY